MEYTFNNIDTIVDNGSLKGYSCVVEEKPLPILQGIFDVMKKEYIRARNVTTEMFIEDYGEDDGPRVMNERYPKPVNIDELANQAKIIANKYEICGTTLIRRIPGFIVKIPNVRVRVRTYCNLGDYYCWIQKYGIDKFELKIYQAMPNEEGYLIFGGSSYPHPHIAGHNPCLGSFDGVIKNCAGHFNMVGVLSNIKAYLNSYYGRSVYLRHTEFRPIKARTLPIETLKEYPSCYMSWDSYYDDVFKEEPLLKPEYNSKEYLKMKDEYMEKYTDKYETIELRPHEANFYETLNDRLGDTSAIYGHVIQKVRLVAHKFDISYYQAYALLLAHGRQVDGKPIVWGSKHTEHRDAWEEIKHLCIDCQNMSYKIGYNDGIYIRPDVSLGDSGLDKKANNLYNKIMPRSGEGTYRLLYMSCKDFWIEINKYKDVEEFLIPQDNYNIRKREVISTIDKLYPEVMQYKDAFSRKIIITLDKNKRRIYNGLKHSTPTPESNQLSLETLSQN